MPQPQYAEAVLDALPDPIAVMDLDGRIEYANKQFLQEVGHTQQEVHGKTPADLGIVEDEEFGRLKREIVPRLLSGQSLTNVDILVRRQGSDPFPSLLSFGLLRSDSGEPRAVVGSGRDIALIREAQEATAEKEKMLQALFHAISEPLLLIDRQGRILTCNEAAATRLKRGMQEIAGAVLSDCLTAAVSPDTCGRRMARIAEVFSSGKAVRFTDERDDRVLDNNLYPVLDNTGDVTSIVIFGRDITDQVRAQKELQEYHKRLRDAERLTSLGMLGATLAHELTQPLSVIRLANETALAELRPTSCPDAITRDLQASITACGAIAAILSQFRNYARQSSGATETEVHLRSVAEWTVRLLEHSAQQAKVTLRMEGLDTLPPIRMQENEPEQVFFALAQNAIEAADGIEDHYLLIAAALHDDTIDLQFEDNCGGIRPADLPKIFEPFFTTKPMGKGTGLGLPIARRIVQERGGRICVQNRYGEGATFVVTLPRSRVGIREACIDMSPQEASVFFVDDDPGIRMTVQRTLETSGFHVSVFSSAEDCLAGLLVQPCDVLITDLRMNGMDGISLLHEVRRRFPWLPTVIATGYGDIPLAVAAIKAGAVEFIEKPLDRQGLLSTIQKVLTVTTRPELPPPEPLSDTELQILSLVLDGRTTREIADTLNRSTRTIEAHRHSIMRKLRVKNIAQLVQRATAIGLNRGSTYSESADTSSYDPSAR
jgi:PAS domain S-box-containing protein